MHPRSRPRFHRPASSARIGLVLAMGAGAAVGLPAACTSRDELPPLHRGPVVTTSDDAGIDADAGDPLGGPIEDPDAPCDANLDVGDPDPENAARAMEICKHSVGGDWGLVSAKWTMIDGSEIPLTVTNYDLGHGLVSGFGAVDVKSGERMLALSSGTARQPTDPDFMPPAGFDKGYTSKPPKGFPKPSKACPGVTTGEPHDGVALEVTLQAPPEAAGFQFQFDFHTFEWPDYICSTFNDNFVALLDPPPPGHPDGNVSFDIAGNPVSVNNAFLRVCGCSNGPPCMAGGKKFTCKLGTDPLVGTGFESHGATGWLVTTAPVGPGATVTLRLATYDSGDGVLDSTTVIDSFTWLGGVDAGVMTIPEDAETPK